MGDQGTEFTSDEGADVQSHRSVFHVDGPTEDVEGHVQPPRGDDTDHLHS